MAVQVKFSPINAFVEFLNANHSKAASIVLNQDISVKDYDLKMINEPFYTDYGIPFFEKSYRVIAGQNKPRTATIIVNKNYKYPVIYVDMDLIILNLEINNDKFIFINVYIPPSVALDDMLIKLEYYINRFVDKKLIILGDLNSKYIY